MKSKTLSLLVFSVLTSLFLISVASAAITFQSVPTLSQSSGAHTFDVKIKATANETVDAISITDIIQGSNTIDFSIDSPSTFPFNMIADEVVTVGVSYNVPSAFDFKFGTAYDTELTVETSSTVYTDTISFEKSGYCEFSDNGNLKVEIDDIKVVRGYGDDDDYWYPLDQIEIDVNVENKGAKDINNIELEWILLTEDGEEVMDGDEKDFDLNDDEDETITIKFKLDPKDLDESSDTYIFQVRATGEDEEFNDDETCSSDSQSVDVNFDDDFVVIDQSKFKDPELAQCNADYLVSTDVWNIGQDDQDDVSVRVFIPELNIDKLVKIGDIDSLDKEKLETTIRIPSDAQEKTYALNFEVFDEDNDIYENDEDDESRLSIPLKVEGGCGPKQPAVLISPRLESGGQAGKDLVVIASITNSGSDAATFSVSASGFSNWAGSADVDKSSLSLPAGATEDVKITIKVNKDVSGEQVFNIDVSSNGAVVVSQPVAVTITAGSGSGITGAFSGVPGISKDNWYLWLIGLLNVILVVVIIIVAVRVARS